MIKLEDYFKNYNFDINKVLEDLVNYGYILSYNIKRTFPLTKSADGAKHDNLTDSTYTPFVIDREDPSFLKSTIEISFTPSEKLYADFRTKLYLTQYQYQRLNKHVLRVYYGVKVEDKETDEIKYCYGYGVDSEGNIIDRVDDIIPLTLSRYDFDSYIKLFMELLRNDGSNFIPVKAKTAEEENNYPDKHYLIFRPTYIPMEGDSIDVYEVLDKRYTENDCIFDVLKIQFKQDDSFISPPVDHMAVSTLTKETFDIIFKDSYFIDKEIFISTVNQNNNRLNSINESFIMEKQTKSLVKGLWNYFAIAKTNLDNDLNNLGTMSMRVKQDILTLNNSRLLELVNKLGGNVEFVYAERHDDMDKAIIETFKHNYDVLNENKGNYSKDAVYKFASLV